jgi:hypothetical protein
MSSDNQYTALGPAAIGFQTYSTDIDTGAQISGNSMGIDAKGPIGVRGTGVQSDTGAGPIGVQGIGDGGPGGSFTSSDTFAQLRLEPQLMERITHDTGVISISVPEPSQQIPKINGLPKHGKLGDLWLVQHVGLHNSAIGLDLGFYAARSYSLMRPPRTGRRWIRSWQRSATG